MAMNFSNFVRECYLRSVPSVDLNKLTGDQKVNCSEHKLALSEYDKILEEFEVKEDSQEILACNMFMLQSGPQLIDDKAV